ncbi:hypothetical protein SAMN04487886_12144 [Clostridium sp. DSM 8431]|nr:hypothetical protein SAMN04487886_12144 [Clostridium sp. DSM 8431]
MDLNLYLMTTGKSEKEIKEFISEAEEHLKLGEADGKSVKDIFRLSPEEYAKNVAREISYDKKDLFSNIIMLLFGFVLVMFFNKIKFGIVSLSSLELLLDFIIFAVTITASLFAARKFAFNDKKLFNSF